MLAKQIVGYADDNAPPDGSANDTARATAALALQARHFEAGPLAFSMGHIPEFVKTAIAAAPQPVGGKRKDGSCNCPGGAVGTKCYSDAVTCNGDGVANADGTCRCNSGTKGKWNRTKYTQRLD